MSRVFEFPIDGLSDSEIVHQWQKEFLNHTVADRQHSNRVRLLKNFGDYSGVDHQQWDADSVRKLAQQNRPVLTINITQNIIDNILGRLEENPLDVNYKPAPTPDAETETSNMAQFIYDVDSERGDYEFEWLKFRRDKLIHTGVLKMYLDQRHNFMGNIGLVARNPAHIWPDANWQTDDIMDCRLVFDANWMTAAQIETTFQTKRMEVLDAVRKFEFETQNSQPLNKAADTSVEFFDQINNRYKVIEVVWMEQLDITNVERDGKVIKKFIGDLKDGELKDLITKQPETFKLKKEQKAICRQCTIAPGLSTDLVLVNDRYPIQIGKLPYIIGSYKNIYGERQGIPDVIHDLQMILNKEESVISHYHATSANNNVLVEEDAFSNPADFEVYKRNRSKGGGAFKMASGANRENKLKPEERQPVPPDMIARAASAFDRAFILPGITPASQGRAERANESGLLFDRKRQQSEVNLEMLAKFNEREMQIWAENYFIAMQQVYDEGFRELGKRSGETLEINKIVATGFLEQETGEPEFAVFNNVSELKRHNIFITASRNGRTRKKELLQLNTEVARITTGPLQLVLLERDRIDLMDLREGLKEEMKSASKKEFQLAESQMDAQIAQLQASTAQFAAQGQQQQGGAQQLGQGPQGPQEINKNPGFGQLPGVSGIQGGQGANNNAPSRAAPSDLIQR